MGLVPYVPPPTSAVPPFAPLRVHGGRHRLRRVVHRRRRAMAAGLAMTAAALAASAPRDPGRPQQQHALPLHERPRADVVSAPVRIADAATVRLLRPGDRVDVIAAGDEKARVVASGARVARVPEVRDDGAGGDGGALVVLSVGRATAAELAGASATSRLAVTLC
ncbi:hypothetical protein [Streptomyces sp. NPDC050738]|uniref:hypothetical protein n=1 Tax=Streptomyces sp. NPDC050738 TaxID=3154744 RepID=UPI00342E6249